MTNISVIPSGSTELDTRLQIGGLPCGKITELFGPPDCGKTYFALNFIKEAQGMFSDSIALILDLDHKINIEQLNSLKIDTANLYLIQPPNNDIKTILNILTDILPFNIDILLIDSISMLAFPNKLFEELSRLIYKTKTVTLLINQYRLHKNADNTFVNKSIAYKKSNIYSSIRLSLDENREMEIIKNKFHQIIFSKII